MIDVEWIGLAAKKAKIQMSQLDIHVEIIISTFQNGNQINLDVASQVECNGSIYDWR